MTWSLPRAPLACLLTLAFCPLRAADPPGCPGVPWPATDALARRLPLADDVGPPKPDRTVGIFYFLWHTNPGGRDPHGDGPFDVSKILARDPDALRKPNAPPWGPIGASHYWGEPLYGYYLATDPWVLRRHAQLLADAGVDVLIFDTTNAVTYPEAYRALADVFTRVRAEGGRTPQFAFMVNTRAGATARRLYDDLYRPGHFRDLWFLWQGKPLLICDPREADPDVRAFFTLRRAHWPFTRENTPHAWHWENAYPQHFGFTDDPARPEQINVSVAQNLRISDGLPTNMSSGDARGRGFHDGRPDPDPAAALRGANFDEQWRRAHALAPPFVMITGWNEWIAGRFGKPGRSVVFVDQYSREYSRDIEPMRGGHADHYLYQMIAGVRRYKGAPPLPAASAPLTIPITDDFSPWAAVRPDYRDHAGETAPRDHPGAGGTHHTNRTGRNDLLACRVARDDKTVAFYLRCRDPITPHPRPDGLTLLIDADANPATGWQGYDIAVNRTPAGDALTVDRHRDGRWTRVGEAPFRVRGPELHLALPRALLGLPEGTAPFTLDFKWADHLARPDDLMDFYLSGDVAPEGRFNYRYAAPKQ